VPPSSVTWAQSVSIQTDPGLTGAHGLVATILEPSAENRGQFAVNQDTLPRVRREKEAAPAATTAPSRTDFADSRIPVAS
jgi:hypothetical protein